MINEITQGRIKREIVAVSINLFSSYGRQLWYRHRPLG